MLAVRPVLSGSGRFSSSMRNSVPEAAGRRILAHGMGSTADRHLVRFALVFAISRSPERADRPDCRTKKASSGRSRASVLSRNPLLSTTCPSIGDLRLPEIRAWGPSPPAYLWQVEPPRVPPLFPPRRGSNLHAAGEDDAWACPRFPPVRLALRFYHRARELPHRAAAIYAETPHHPAVIRTPAADPGSSRRYPGPARGAEPLQT